MTNETDTWVMTGVRDDDPSCVHNYDELVTFINEVGFIPLFRNDIPGFSVEEHANPYYWWTGYEERDPWEWRKLAARYREVAYGKFFGGKAGFISLEWLPVFISARRKGEDFESMWFSGQIQFRQKKIMDCLTDAPELASYELKRMAGFGKGGEKNFDGTITALQDLLFVVISDFRRRKNKWGQEYGWDVSVYSRPEERWGAGLVDAAYDLHPVESYERIVQQIENYYLLPEEKTLFNLIGKRP